MTKKKENKILIPRRELFCHYYMLGNKKGEDKFRLGNGTRSYAKAYNKKTDTDKQMAICAVHASGLLKNSNIRRRMREILEDAGFNNEAVDSRLHEIIYDGENKDSNIAIREYNKLKQRITEKIEHSGKIPLTSIIINPVKPKKDEKTDNGED